MFINKNFMLEEDELFLMLEKLLRGFKDCGRICKISGVVSITLWYKLQTPKASQKTSKIQDP